MSKAKKIVIAVFSIIIIGALAFMVTWVVINFDNIKAGLSGTELYTKEDIDNAYNDGFNTALGNKENYESLINDYKDTITSQTDVIAQLNEQNETLEKSILDYQSQVNALTTQRDDLLKQIENLQAEIKNDEDMIASLRQEKQDLIDQHQQTVNKLNAQIAQLNSQIDYLNTQIQLNLSMVNQLNARIAELQKTIAFYESFIGELETDDVAIVIFEFGGSVIDVKRVNKGDKVSIADPESTEYLIFNGWTVDGQPIDLSEYTVTKSVRIIADVTYKYVVNFTVDGTTKYTQIVEKGGYPEEPDKPRKTNFTFKYWTLNGETEVDVTTIQIMSNTTFIAKFARLYTVSFQYYDGTEIVSRRIEEGTTTSAAKITSDDEHLVLKGWKLNGSYVDVSSWVITSDTVFVADITYMYTIKFMTDDVVYNEQTIEIGNKISVPRDPTKDNYNFKGWTLNNAAVDVYSIIVEDDLTFYAVFEKSSYKVVAYNKPFTDMTQNTFKVEKGEIVPLLGAEYITFEQEIMSGDKVTGFKALDCISYSIESEFKCFAKVVITGNTLSFEEVADVMALDITEDTFLVPLFNDTAKYGTVYTVTYYDVDGSLLGTEKVTYGGVATQPYKLREADGLYYDFYYWAFSRNSSWMAYFGNITEDTSYYMVAHRKGTSVGI